MNCYLSTNSLVDVIGTQSYYIKKSKLENWMKLSRQPSDSFLTLTFDLFMFYRRYLNYRQ